MFIQCKSGAVGAGDVWVFGGDTGDEVLDDLCVYNLKERKWRRPVGRRDAAAAWPSARAGHTANVVKVSALGAATEAGPIHSHTARYKRTRKTNTRVSLGEFDEAPG